MPEQDYSFYTAADQEVWNILFKRQIAVIEDVAYMHFKKGINLLGFNETVIPAFSETNRRLEKITGWSIYAVPGLIENEDFFRLMHQKKFGATTWLRKKEQIDYLEEPDMFHDVFGHVPLLADAVICDYLFALADIAHKNNYDKTVVTAISRLYWYSIEFGLVKENGIPKIYGAGILSSPGETKYCLSPDATRVDFDIEQIIAYPYVIDTFQQQYYVLHNMQQLLQASKQLEEMIDSNKLVFGKIVV